MRFARSGISLRLAATGENTSMSDYAGASLTSPFTRLDEAMDADVVIFAVPFSSHRILARGRLTWHGQIVVDAMYTPTRLGVRNSIDVISAGLPGARIVQASWRRCALAHARLDDQALVYLAGDNAQANKAIAGLATSLGYVPMILNRLASADGPATRSACEALMARSKMSRSAVVGNLS